MASLDMKGPYELASQNIDEAITQTSPGNYALGYDTLSEFIALYIGRSDSDVQSRLKSWVGKSHRYRHFKFSYAISPQTAFEKECKNYHHFGECEKLDNVQHPQRPDGSSWICPLCAIFG